MQVFITANLLYMFRVSIAPIIRSTSNCNCSFWYRSYHVPEQKTSSNVAIGHGGGRLLLRYYDLYQKLRLQFYVFPMMGAIDTRNM